MRTLLVAGSRTFHPMYDQKGILRRGWTQSQMHEVLNQASYCLDRTFDNVIHGGARGVDTMAGEWARSKGYPVDIFKPNWDKYGKAAGFIRNGDMVNACSAAILVWDGVSRGTKDTLDKLIFDQKPFVLVCREP